MVFFVFALFLLNALGPFVLLAQLRFEKGVRRGHRLGDVVVLDFDVDEGKQVEGPLPCPPTFL